MPLKIDWSIVFIQVMTRTRLHVISILSDHAIAGPCKLVIISLLLLSFQYSSYHDDTYYNTRFVSAAVTPESGDSSIVPEQRTLQTTKQQEQQQSPPNNQSTNVCSNNPSLSIHSSSPPKVIDQVLDYLDEQKSSIQAKIFQSFTDKHRNVTKNSVHYLYEDFRSNLEWMARDGIPNPNSENPFKFFLGPENCNNDGWQIGLINVAAFLSQAMTLGIQNDTCDELNWEMVLPEDGNVFEGVYPLSNACGMRGWEYQAGKFFSCSGKDEVSGVRFDCEAKRSMRVKAVDKARFGGTPPELECYPRTEERTYTGYFDPAIGVRDDKVVESVSGRTDVEGCCWWGRGALHTKGTCNLGKLNFYLGKRAADEGRDSRYPDIDFCDNPEAICSDIRTMEMRWVVALFEWVERIQSFDFNGWNYMEQLQKVVDGDLLNDLKFEKSNFIDEVGAVLEQGCPTPPCDAVEKRQRLNWANKRKANFRSAVEALGLPIKSSAFREIESMLMKGKEVFEEIVLSSVNPDDKQPYQSYRYQFADFIEALRLMSDIGYDDKFFYIGQPLNVKTHEDGAEPNGDFDVVSGIINICLFLSQAVAQSIREDACDEHNIQLVNGKYPVSNSCGQFGLSYQDINCTGASADMTCPLDTNQSFSGVTRALTLRAPQPFKCAPKSQFPVTGYWDERRVEEDHKTAFSNQLGRTDVEGCCWWGRGVFRNVTRGRCFFGQLNYHIGKRAAIEGRPSLYPSVDFCEFPEAVCASEFSHELRWVAGMFHWIHVVQSYDQRGWSYMEKIRNISAIVAINGTIDSSLAMQVDCILKTGKVKCDVAMDTTDIFGEVLSAVANFNLPTASPTVTQPTLPPVDFPTTSPVVPPTPFPSISTPPTSSPVIFVSPSKPNIDIIMKYLEEKRSSIEAKILTPLTTDELGIYTFEGFTETLSLMATGITGSKSFYVGHGSNNAESQKRGLVNIAAFLAHVRTLSIEANTCDELNRDFINQTQYPLSNACGQYGASYQDMRCDTDESFMECKPDPEMQVTGVAKDNPSGQPPPFFCGPKEFFPFTGYYDSAQSSVINDVPKANRLGRDDVESCCWWGRGAAQAAGVCMYGKLNYYLKSLFPSVDLCKYPGSVCSGPYSFTLMWITGMFVWVESAQSDAFYSAALDRYVLGEINDQELADTISDRLASGRDKEKRLKNFQLALTALEIE
eukprot:CCRYP_018038-RD/>CCRYP_018038-RD protein AED:0.19 eAED:0.19 QI:308/1/1/1/0.81/0.70/17/2275/1193